MDLRTLMQELLIETALFYNSDNRSSGSAGTCAYVLEERRCALGRILTDETIADLLKKGRNFNYSAVEVLRGYGPKAVIEKWRPIAEETGNGWVFMQLLQALHDHGPHWSAKGITTKGEDHVREMVRKFGLDLSPVLAAIDDHMTKE